jgi:hypothetical protein
MWRVRHRSAAGYPNLAIDHLRCVGSPVSDSSVMSEACRAIRI